MPNNGYIRMYIKNFAAITEKYGICEMFQMKRNVKEHSVKLMIPFSENKTNLHLE